MVFCVKAVNEYHGNKITGFSDIWKVSQTSRSFHSMRRCFLLSRKSCQWISLTTPGAKVQEHLKTKQETLLWPCQLCCKDSLERAHPGSFRLSKQMADPVGQGTSKKMNRSQQYQRLCQDKYPQESPSPILGGLPMVSTLTNDFNRYEHILPLYDWRPLLHAHEVTPKLMWF